MFLKMISSDDNIIQEGEYINKNGETIENNNLSMDKTLFKRTIVIKEVISPFIAQKIKNITVQIWYPGCDFSSDPCKSKSFLITEPHLYE